MSSFQKNVETFSIFGTKIKNSLLYVSSGIPSLDHIIGGGLPCGGIFIIEEDVLGHYSKVLMKYFLAEGVVCKHDLFVASSEEPPMDIVYQLPRQCAAPAEEGASASGDVDKMKIAWRYEGLQQVDSSFGTQSTFGHNFDLSKHIDTETLTTTNITCCDLSNFEASNTKGLTKFKNSKYHKLLLSIKQVMSKYENNRENNSEKILRISIQSIGSPYWMYGGWEGDTEALVDLQKFMYCLRILIRNTNAVAIVTIPTHLFGDDDVVKRLLYTIDNGVRIESFAGSDKETNPVYKDYHGLFHITKLSAVNSMVPYVPPSLDLAFKLRRKKFVIEKLHLPPELQESSEREQDDVTAVPKPAAPAPMCGGFKKKDIDF